MGLSVYVKPALDPISLAEAKAHLRVEIASDDALIAGLILSARQWVETYCRRALMTQTLDYKFGSWPACIVLPRPPHQSVTSVSYVDPAGATQTLSASLYQTDLSDASLAGRIMPAYGQSWPSLRLGVFNAVTVRYVAGYGSNPGDVPYPIRQAILLLVGHLYESREAINIGNIVNELPFSVRALLDPYRDPDSAF